jgi:hypothetical protein
MKNPDAAPPTLMNPIGIHPPPLRLYRSIWRDKTPDKKDKEDPTVISPRQDGLHVTGRRGSFGADPERRNFRTKVDRWREDNPDAFRTWTTAHGAVVQFWGQRIYYGRCQFVVEHADNCLTSHGSKTWKCRDCTRCCRLVHTRRSIQGKRHRDGKTELGRWPMYCGECRQRASQRSADRNRKYAANYRRAMYERRGFGPRQGIPGVGAALARQEREQKHLELYHFDDDDGDNGCYDLGCRYNPPVRP